MSLFDQELLQLNGKLLHMGALVESAIKDSVRALIENNTNLARAVIDRDFEVNSLDVAIDEECVRLIALRQPKAKDLRFITTAMKVVTDLERMGDLAVNVAQRAAELGETPPMKPYENIPRMREIAQSMTRDALDAFVKRDKQLALDVIMRDTRIDDLKKIVLSDLLMLMSEQPSGICWCMKVSFVAQYLERIADHATNIAEMVVYLIEGRIIRHMHSTHINEGC